ncbi:MAG: carboxypeptidase-like regulatory domain-containing protein, partial [Bacteroidota bacterium]
MQKALTFLCVALPLFLFGQGFTHTGCIIDAKTGTPLVGATIQWIDTSNGTVSDFEGCYTLKLSKDSVELWINRTGFVDQTILSVVGKASVIELQANEGLDEIVITGEVRNRRRLASRNERLAKKPAESSAKISGLPTREVDGAMTRTAGVRSEGTEEVAIRGSRTDADTYYVDGVSVSEVEKGETFEDAIATEPAMSREEAFARGMGSIETDYPVPPAEKLPEAGQLTAGEVNDFGKWELWEDVSREDLAAYREVWQILPAHRYAVQLTFPGGQPATNLTVQLVT